MSDFVIENGILKRYTGIGGKVVIPEGVTTIGKHAFRSCHGLQELTIPGTVKTIDSGAFMDCDGLMTLTLGEGVTEICDSAFAQCRSIEHLVIPGSAKLGELAFGACEGLRSLELRPGITDFGNQCFGDCSGLETVILPSTLKSVPEHAFFCCVKLRKVELPEGLTHIGQFAFARCENLGALAFPSSIEEIGVGAFMDCKSLRPENIPLSVNRAEVFRGCEAMADENGLLIFDGVLVGIFGNQAHRVIPEGVTEILGFAVNNNHLRTLSLPASLRRIASGFGHWTTLETLEVPDTVTYVGASFLNCAWYLRELTLSGQIRYLDRDSLLECSELEYLQAPGLSWATISDRELEIPATVGFLCGRERYSQFQQAEPYVRYALNNKGKVLEYFYKADDIRGVQAYGEMGMITPKNFEKEFLQPAVAAKAATCVAWLLNWKKENLGDAPGDWNI